MNRQVQWILILLLLALLSTPSRAQGVVRSVGLLDIRSITETRATQLAMLPGVRAIAAGAEHTCAVTGDQSAPFTGSGAVYCWGRNEFGQLGDGTLTKRTFPVNVRGLSNGVSAIAAGERHSCALLTTGGVQCWGNNDDGQLGNGATISSTTPVEVNELNSGVSAIAVGQRHTCVLLITGGVQCWGNNYFGQLGDGTTDDRSHPVDVNGLNSGVSAIAAGREHTCAVTTNGSVKCWGYNDDGQLGDGTDDNNRANPVDVNGLSSRVVVVAAGGDHTCALLTTGGVQCWGITYDPLPVDVSGLSDGVSAIAAGALHTCAVTTNGGVACWGSNNAGQLGDGTMTNRPSPVAVSGLNSGVSAITAGNYHTCALIGAPAGLGGVKCWGRSDKGQLGIGETAFYLTPVDVSELTSGVNAIAVGGEHTCALTGAPPGSGGVQCWGNNYFGQLGDGTTAPHATPRAVSGLNSEISTISAGERHTCTVTVGGGVQCWGLNSSGQLGDGTLIDRTTPVDVSGLNSGISAVAAGRSHTCALTASGSVKCWGTTLQDSLTTTVVTTPTEVSGLNSTVSALAAGGEYTCALLTTGAVQCWGGNFYGQPTPVVVNGLSSGVSAITAGAYHTCALATTGGVQCWGITYGSLPVDVNGLSSGVSAIAAGAMHTCALLVSGSIKCWGNNYFGQLGDGTMTDRTLPTEVRELSGGSAISAGENHTCTLTTSGGIKCWGFNGYGQIGSGEAGYYRMTPVDVLIETVKAFDLFLPVVTRD